ncbi:MAG: hypothetical protein J0M26_28485 [Planctomycetes bacterium]|nr:hypothetical protein [Planctomycetota bacterium]
MNKSVSFLLAVLLSFGSLSTSMGCASAKLPWLASKTPKQSAMQEYIAKSNTNVSLQDPAFADSKPEVLKPRSRPAASSSQGCGGGCSH